MKKDVQLAILGGDARQIAMARALRDYGYPVLLWGFSKLKEKPDGLTFLEHWKDAILTARAVILPLPASADGVRVHCPLHDPDVLLRLTSLMDAMQGKLLLGGRLSEGTRSIAEQKGIAWYDYFDSESLQLKNAVPTAEGAIEIAMRELSVTIDGVHAAVIGYGRIGSLLAGKLQGLGAKVTVYARREEQLTLAKIHHHKAERLVCEAGRTTLKEIPASCRVIFNTVPQWIFTREVLQTLPKDCLLIDLASAPGGIDSLAAKELGIRNIWATALPGKCAPESAGIFLAETVANILENIDFTSAP